MTGLMIAVPVPIRGRSFAIMASSLGAFFSLSSAPLQGIVIGLALLIYDRVLRQIQFKWLGAVILGAAGIVMIFLIHNDPVGVIIRHIIFDPESGYYRLWIWTSVIDAVSQSPWFGLGFEPYREALNLDHSVDSLWLVLAIQCGIPGAVLVALSMIGAVSLPAHGPGVSLTAAESKLGTALGIVIFLTFFLAFTVDLWGSTWMLSGLLLGVRAHLGELGRVSRPVRGPAGHHRAADRASAEVSAPLPSRLS